MPVRFLDTNILLRYFTRDDPAKATLAFALLTRVERGEESVETSPLIVFETVYTLERIYRVPKPRIRELLSNVLHLRGIRLPGRALCFAALDVYVNKNVSFADAYSAVYMQSRGLAEIYSWDPDFDRIPDIDRVEPT